MHCQCLKLFLIFHWDRGDDLHGDVVEAVSLALNIRHIIYFLKWIIWVLADTTACWWWWVVFCLKIRHAQTRFRLGCAI